VLKYVDGWDVCQSGNISRDSGRKIKWPNLFQTALDGISVDFITGLPEAKVRPQYFGLCVIDSPNKFRLFLL